MLYRKPRQLLLVVTAVVIITIIFIPLSQYLATLHLSSSIPKTHEKSATSGRVYRIEKIRTVNSDLLRFQKNDDSASTKESKWPESAFWNRPDCKKWGAATTIFPPTVAVNQFVAMDGWCLVVAGDQKGPITYQVEAHQNKLVFLSMERQEELAQRLPFVKMTPWNHFARKNVAYLYAIANGAELIWDFDDDNILLPNETLARYTNADRETKVITVDTRNNSECGVFNPYPFFRSSEADIWPWGYPLEKINAAECQLSTKYCITEVRTTKIGIYQSLANKDPDVDAVYRLTRRLPVTFAGAVENLPVLIPTKTMSPMNAQASLFSRIGFWSMFLPTTVHGRVSDIWRSYITQAIAKRCGMLVSFVGPHVTQDRNVHSYLADMDAEGQLYERAGSLVSYLLAREDSEGTFASAWERLYVDLYERGILDWNDVELAQQWISSLQSVGYDFSSCDATSNLATPAIQGKTGTIACKERPSQDEATVTQPKVCSLSNVVLVGQFNYNLDSSLVTHWISRWRQIFWHVDVRGPFNESVTTTKRAPGIGVFKTAADKGWYSPMKNLADSLRRYANDPSVCGVLIAHDDLLFNISYLEERGFPAGDKIFAQFPGSALTQPTFTLYPNKTYKQENHKTLYPIEMYNKTFKFWGWWQRIIPNATRAVASARNREYYVNAEGGLDFFGHKQGDFLYVPTSLSEQFASYADWMVENEIMLEVAVPMIIARMQNSFSAVVEDVSLCTVWDYKIRAQAANWVSRCFGATAFGTVHPVKLTSGLAQWDKYFNSIVLGK